MKDDKAYLEEAIRTLTYWLVQVGVFGVHDLNAMTDLLNKKRPKKRRR